VALAVVGALALAAIYGARQVYFLGVDEGGRMALYRGLPYELPFGIELYDERYSSPVQVDSLPADLQGNVTAHELRSHDDAASLIEQYESDAQAAAARPRPGGEGDQGKPAGNGGQRGSRQRESGDRSGGRRGGDS
jgi:hypothetical protein